MKHKLFFFIYKILGLILCLIFWDAPYFWWIILSYLVIYLVVTFSGSYYIHFNWFINSVNENKEEGVTFTFDDGPHPKNTALILDILRKHNIKATFFVIGKQVEKHPELVVQLFNEGHIIGNHSYSHSNYIPFFKRKKLINDFKKTDELLYTLIKKKPNFIRPPFGATSPKYTNLLKKTNYSSIGWSYRSFDTTLKSKTNLVQNTLNAIDKNKNAILLFHDTKNVTVESLDDILQNLLDNGTKIVNLDESLNQLPYA